MRTCKNCLPEINDVLAITEEERYIIRLRIEGMSLYENPLGWVFDKRNATSYNLETIKRRIDEVEEIVTCGMLDYIRG